MGLQALEPVADLEMNLDGGQRRSRISARFAGLRAVLLLLALGVVRCSGASSPATNSTDVPSTDYCKGTVHPGQVAVYSAPGLKFWYSDILSNFQENCGVTVYYEELPSSDLLQFMKYESKTPVADVVVAQPPYITTMADLGLLEANGLPQANSVPADRCDRLRRWCTVVDNFTSWVYNPSLVAQPPSGYDDLAGPGYQAKIVTARVDSTADGIALAILMAHQLGLQGGLDVLRQLEPNVSAHYLSTDAMSHAVSAGNALVGNGDLAEELNDITQYGRLALWFPAVGGSRQTLSLPFAAGLASRARDQKNANSLLAYMWSVAGQQLVGSAFGAPARPDVQPTDSRSRAVVSALKGVDVVRIDWEQAAAQQAQLTSAWLAFRRAPDGVPLPAPLTGFGPTTTFSLPP